MFWKSPIILVLFLSSFCFGGEQEEINKAIQCGMLKYAEQRCKQALEDNEISVRDKMDIMLKRLLVCRGSTIWFTNDVDMYSNDPKFAEFVEKGVRLLYMRGALDEALLLCEKALTGATNAYDRVEIQRQKLFVMLLKREDAQQEAEMVAAQLPSGVFQKAELWYSLGKGAHVLGEYDFAVECFKKASVECSNLSQNEFSNDHWCNRATLAAERSCIIALIKDGKEAEAEQLLSEVDEQNEYYPVILLDMAKSSYGQHQNVILLSC